MESKKVEEISRGNKQTEDQIDNLREFRLQVFENVERYKESYKLCDRKKDNKENNLENLYISEFKGDSFISFIKWFKNIELYARLHNLSKDAVFRLIDNKLKSLQNKMKDLFPSHMKISNMLELQTLLLDYLFHTGENNSVMYRLIKYRSQTTETNGVIEQLKDFFLEVLLAMVAFKNPVVTDKTFLTLAFLEHLPYSFRKYCFSSNRKLRQLTLREMNDYVEEVIQIIKGPQSGSPRTMALKRSYSNMVSNEVPAQLKCDCCGEVGHVNINCRHKNEICENSKNIGHSSKMCVNSVLKEQKRKPIRSLEYKVKDFNSKEDNIETCLQKIQVAKKFILKRFIRKVEISEETYRCLKDNEGTKEASLEGFSYSNKKPKIIALTKYEPSETELRKKDEVEKREDNITK